MTSGFSSADLVDWFHDRPRFGGTNDIQELKLEAGNEYAEGVVYNFAIFAVLAVLLSVVTLFLHCAACCRCCCYKRRNDATLDSKDAPDGKRGRRRCLFTLLALLLVAASLASAVLVARMIDGAKEVKSGVDDGIDVMDRGNDLTDSMLSALRTALDDAEEVQTQRPSQEADDMVDALTAAIASVQDVSDGLGSSIDELRDGSDSADDYNDTALLVGSLYVAVAGVWAVLVTLALYVCMKRCRCTFKLLMQLALPLLFITWLFTGVLFAVGLVSADTCADPEANIEDLVGVELPITDNTSPEASIYYYLNCDVAATPEAGVVVLVDDAVAEVDDAYDAVNDVPADPLIDAELESIKAELNTTRALLAADTDDSLASLVECDSLNGVWVAVRDGLCEDTLEPLVQLWGVQLCAATLLFVAVVVAMPFWNKPAEPKQATPVHHGTELGPVTSAGPSGRSAQLV